MDDRLIYREKAYSVVGLRMEVHGIPGKGHSGTVYKDGLTHKRVVL